MDRINDTIVGPFGGNLSRYHDAMHIAKKVLFSRVSAFYERLAMLT